MSTKGTFKYICEDCSEATYVSARQRTSRFLPKCTSCGGYLTKGPRTKYANYMNIEAKEAYDDQRKKLKAKQNFK